MDDGYGAVADEWRGAFRLDSTDPRGPRDAGVFRRAWEENIGETFPLPALSPETAGDFRIRIRAARACDVFLADFATIPAGRTADAPDGADDQVALYIVESGTWSVGGTPRRGEHTVPAGQFCLRAVRWPSRLRTAPHTTARLVAVGADALDPGLRDRGVARGIGGRAGTAEVRLLTAHARMTHETLADLSPAGVRAARNATIELIAGVARGRFDDAESELMPALARAARDLADRYLADAGLCPSMLARELHVSVRTLQRAFEGTGESVAAYVRRRRLEEARRALTEPNARLSVSELAAYWHFADSSHFIRAFKKQYGRTPAACARAGGPEGLPEASPAGRSGPGRAATAPPGPGTTRSRRPA